MIIDMRCRLTTKDTAAYFVDRMEVAGQLSKIPALIDGSAEAFFKEIESAGITTAVSVSGNNPGIRIGRMELPARTTSNDLLADVQKKYPGRFIGVAGIDAGNVFHNALEEIERCVKVLGLKAVYIEPGRSPGCLLNDRRLYRIYQKCVDLNVPIIPQTSGVLGGKSIDYGHPKYIEEVAEDFPDLNIICGHACNPYTREMIVVAARHPNIYPSPDAALYKGHGMGSLVQDLDQEAWVCAVNENYFGLSDRFLFGSAYPLIPIKSYVDEFFKLPWDKKVLDKILYKNAIKALKLESDPVIRKMYKLD